MSSHLTVEERTFFQNNGYLNFGPILDEVEVAYFSDLFDTDQRTYSYFWHPYGKHQYGNYDALITTPQFDELIRHPKLIGRIAALFGGPVCFGEIGLRQMGPYRGELHTAWHRDRGFWYEHSLHLDYLQLIVYLTNVDETTHCLSLSPKSVALAVLDDTEAQLKRDGKIDILGPAGTCAVFNVALLHTATTRPTDATRKSVQIYYGHANRAPLANDSGIPATLWRDHEDPETRSFYGNLNARTKLFMRAFSASDAH